MGQPLFPTNNVLELTEQQRMFLGFCMFYDNIYGADFPPEEYIIRDYDLLQQWLDEQREESIEIRKNMKSSAVTRGSSSRDDGSLQLPEESVAFKVG